MVFVTSLEQSSFWNYFDGYGYIFRDATDSYRRCGVCGLFAGAVYFPNSAAECIADQLTNSRDQRFLSRRYTESVKFVAGLFRPA